MESDDGSEIMNQLFTNLRSNSNKLKKRYFRKTSVGVFFAERFSRTMRDLHEIPGFEKRDANWIELLPTLTKRISKRMRFATKLPPIENSLEKNEEYVY